MSKKRKRRTGRPTTRLHEPRAPRSLAAQAKALRAAMLLPRRLATEGSPAEAARLVVRSSFTFPPLMVSMVAGYSSVRRVAEVADAALRLAPANRRVLAFAAQAALMEGDHERALCFLDRASPAGEVDEGLRQTRAAAMLAAGRMAEAVREIDLLCLGEPEGFGPQALRAEALTVMERRVSRPANEACSCGSGLVYAACCRETELDALRRFGDRTDLEALVDKVLASLADLDGFLAYAAEPWDRAYRCWHGDGYVLSKSEHLLCDLWGAGTIGPPPEDDPGPGGSGERLSVLELLAQLPEFRGSSGDLIDAWAGGSARLGVWQVKPDQRGPGIMVMDLLTGLKIYAAVEPEVRQELVHPWSVLVGMMVSFDGLWRSLPGLVLLSPAEADTLLGRVHELAGVIAERDPEVAIERPVETIPHSMWIEAAPPLHQISVLVNDTFVTLLPNLLAEALAASKPQPAVTDDAVPVRAVVTAGDLGALWGGLLEREDVHRHRCDELWWPSGVDSDEDSANDIQATIRLDDGSLAISVGAKAHLDALLEVMREIEPSAMVARQTTSPAGAPPAPWAAPLDGSAQAVALWERQWPDEAAFALHCYSPREAAETNDSQPLVELMLRELEFHAARARAEGRPAPDMAVVRDGLGMALPPTALTVPTAA